jgi:hypothetical protein
MVALLEGRHGAWAAEVAEFFSIAQPERQCRSQLSVGRRGRARAPQGRGVPRRALVRTHAPKTRKTSRRTRIGPKRLGTLAQQTRSRLCPRLAQIYRAESERTGARRDAVMASSVRVASAAILSRGLRGAGWGSPLWLFSPKLTDAYPRDVHPGHWL